MLYQLSYLGTGPSVRLCQAVRTAVTLDKRLTYLIIGINPSCVFFILCGWNLCRRYAVLAGKPAAQVNIRAAA